MGLRCGGGGLQCAGTVQNSMKTRKTIVGSIDPEVLAFTVGKDPAYDLLLAEVDCIGSAAHVTMLSKLALKRRLYSAAEARRVVETLVGIIQQSRRGALKITADDQDIHMAVERILTEKLGVLGRRLHTARSRNDQVALDVRLYAKRQFLDMMDSMESLAATLLTLARKHRHLPMVGRTHLQPAMPSSIALWAGAHAEALADDAGLVRAAYDYNDRCPLGSAAGYGVSLPIDRNLTSRLLGFREPVHTVLHASNARGKCEYAIVSSLSAVMLTLSRLSEDLILYSMPEFGYFKLPAAYCTGSSIMPQKRNPDVMELIRARTGNVLASVMAVGSIVKGLPTGYSRDLQETKPHLIESLETTRASVRILDRVIAQIEVDQAALIRGFSPGVFATDRALDLVAGGMPFRDAYDQVKTELNSLANENPVRSLDRKKHLGAPGAVDFAILSAPWKKTRAWLKGERGRYFKTLSTLLGCPYPELTGKTIRRKRS